MYLYSVNFCTDVGQAAGDRCRSDCWCFRCRDDRASRQVELRPRSHPRLVLQQAANSEKLRQKTERFPASQFIAQIDLGRLSSPCMHVCVSMYITYFWFLLFIKWVHLCVIASWNISQSEVSYHEFVHCFVCILTWAKLLSCGTFCETVGCTKSSSFAYLVNVTTMWWLGTMCGVVNPLMLTVALWVQL